MKTTVEIADSLLADAKRSARTRGVPLRQLIEEGLRTVLERDRRPAVRFQLRDGSFEGSGPVGNESWQDIRDRSYEGRGG